MNAAAERSTPVQQPLQFRGLLSCGMLDYVQVVCCVAAPMALSAGPEAAALPPVAAPNPLRLLCPHVAAPNPHVAAPNPCSCT